MLLLKENPFKSSQTMILLLTGKPHYEYSTLAVGLFNHGTETLLNIIYQNCFHIVYTLDYKQ